MSDTSFPAPSEHATVSPRLVLATIFGFWFFYFAMVTLRSFVVDTDPLTLVGSRAIISVLGMAVTAVMWLALRRLDGKSIGVRIAATMLLAIPAAIATAAINHAVFDARDKSMLDDGKTVVIVDRTGRVIVDTRRGIDFEKDPATRWVREISEIAVGRYFLLIAWGALFVALGYAAEVGLAERRSAAFRRAAKAAELRSLRYQVNPHFLFNTLNSLSALVMTGRKEDAETMIQTLSTFYRTSLTGDPTVDVRLSEEIGFQQLYLAIETVRFPERLRVVVHLPDALQDVCVPGLILQPLVENAVKHGVAGSTQTVTVSIVARQLGDRLAITVANDGRAEAPPPNGTGIGLANVRDRLAARYGDEAEAEVARPLAGGFEVTLHLPLVFDGC